MLSEQAERGATATEFAAGAVILFLLVFGAVQMGIAVNRSNVMAIAAREGAAAGTRPGATASAVVAAVADRAGVRDKSAFTFGCPDDLETLPIDVGCVHVERREANGKMVELLTRAAQPCDERGTAVIVTAAYRTVVMIPLVGSRPVTIEKHQELACQRAA